MAIAIAGTQSGVGKTTVTLAILAALQQWQIAIQSFKVGPDYIDPMFHTEITGRACRNLDPVLTSPDYVKFCFNQHAAKAEGAVIEGVMGLFDGAGSTDFASTAHVVKLLGKSISTLLVVDCSKTSRSLAALIYGYQHFDPELNLAGIILNRVGSDRHYEILLEAIAPLGIPVLGIIPRTEQIKLRDRHLGLIPTLEVENFGEIVDQLAELGKRCFDWEKLLPLILHSSLQPISSPPALSSISIPRKVRVAVARDRAFSFYYADNLELLEQLGAELLPWSPLEDSQLPEGTQGVYLGGGFPEIFAAELAENKLAIANLQKTSIPIYAECGGLMYLSQAITNFNGDRFEMVGKLPTETIMTDKLTLGYRQCHLSKSYPWLPSESSSIWGHEFHRSAQTQSALQPPYQLTDYNGKDLGGEGWYLPNLLASYIHLHWGNCLTIPAEFLRVCSSAH